jgi:predicted DNA-binding transcriptional regulator
MSTLLEASLKLKMAVECFLGFMLACTMLTLKPKLVRKRLVIQVVLGQAVNRMEPKKALQHFTYQIHSGLDNLEKRC